MEEKQTGPQRVDKLRQILQILQPKNNTKTLFFNFAKTEMTKAKTFKQVGENAEYIHEEITEIII